MQRSGIQGSILHRNRIRRSAIRDSASLTVDPSSKSGSPAESAAQRPDSYRTDEMMKYGESHTRFSKLVLDWAVVNVIDMCVILFIAHGMFVSRRCTRLGSP